MIDEELLFSTLAQRMEDVRWVGWAPGQFLTTTRRIVLFAEVPTEMQPWCGQAEHGTTEEQVTGLPYKTVLEATWIIYQDAARGPGVEGAILNNLILGGVRRALAPRPSDVGYPDRRNTLGNLVHHCFIQGRIFKDPGDIDGQGMLTVPIKLLVP